MGDVETELEATIKSFEEAKPGDDVCWIIKGLINDIIEFQEDIADTLEINKASDSEKLTSCPVALAMQAALAPSMHHRMPKAVLQFANELSSMPELCKKN